MAKATKESALKRAIRGPAYATRVVRAKKGKGAYRRCEKGKC